ncbi:MAG: hypothetical protein ACE5DS_09060, partial [Kiloniellaceae bacterium]
MAALARRAQRSTNIWPGFVDALATLLLVIMFLVIVFVLAQFFLSEALSGRDAALQKLESQVSELAELLGLERAQSSELRLNVAQLSEELQASVAQRDDLNATIEALTLRAWDRILTISPSVTEQVQRRRPDAQVTCVYTGVDDRWFALTPATTRRNPRRITDNVHPHSGTRVAHAQSRRLLSSESHTKPDYANARGKVELRSRRRSARGRDKRHPRRAHALEPAPAGLQCPLPDRLRRSGNPPEQAP